MNRTLLPWLALLVASVSAFATTYEIGSANAFINFRKCTAADTIKLTSDIDMNGIDFAPLCPEGFYGVFDGGDKTISKMNIVASMKTHPNMAFIAVLGEGGVLKNVSFKNANIVAYQQGNGGVHGASVAVAVGKLDGGSVENVHVIGGKVSISLGSNSDGEAGGLAGNAESGSISESDGSMTIGGSNGAHVGGICGSVTSDVTLTSVTYTGTSNVDIAGSGMEAVTLVNKYGALTVTEKNSVRTVDIDGNYMGTDAVEIPTDIEVNSVTLNRTFTEKVISTLYVPFEIAADKIEGASVYKFNTVVKSDVDGRWKFKVLTTETVEANTPYVILPSATQVTFDATSFILNTSNPVTHSEGKWEFKGTYELVTFEETSNDAFYVFAGQECVGTKLGQFVKSSGYANPMRAYLIYHKNANVAAKSASGNLGSNILLPDELDIEIENENGVVVQTGTLNTVTGEVRMDRWYDLKGRKLNSKPTVKGTYYKNGEKAIIK